jgi:predicted RND superfamily exporter protein/predicted LPLAT superfamily acyltransferase
MSQSARRWLWVGLLVLAALGAARLRFDVEILNLLPDNLAVGRGLKVYQKHFSNARELIIVLEAPAPDEAQSAAGSLARLLRVQTNLVADVVWQPAWMDDPAQATELIAYFWLNQPPGAFGELARRFSTAAGRSNTLAEAREELATSFSPNALVGRSYDPFALTRLPESVSGAAPTADGGEEIFVSRDGMFRLLFIEAKPDITSYQACRDWLDGIERAIAEARRAGELPASVRLHFTGRPKFVTEIAGGMERDMIGSIGGTLATIGILFWLTHRRLRPMFWLLALLVAVLAGTTALGGLAFGNLNVVSIGFAAILLGLAEDFGIVIYQESRSHPELNEPELRRAVAPGIFWSAVTTSGAFLVLNFSTLPGLGQLGTLVAIGIVLAALVMVFAYLPLLLRFRRQRDAAGAPVERFLLFNPQRLLPARIIWIITALLAAASAGVLWQAGPRFDHSTAPLRLKNSEANATLDLLKQRFGRQQEPLWVMVSGADEAQVGQRLIQAGAALDRALADRLIAGFNLPTALWPQPEAQRANRLAVENLLRERPEVLRAAHEAGFTANALRITEGIFDHWQRAAATTNIFWPTNRASHWVFGKIMARTDDGLLAIGLVHRTNSMQATHQFAAHWPEALERDGIIISGWDLLGTTVFDTVVEELPRVLLPIAALVVFSLWLAFRSAREVALSLVTLLFSGVWLWATMAVLGWEWNVLNLMALPLLLGMGVDYGIHIQLALRRYGGDLLAVRRSVGRALLLAGATTVAGFGSLAFSSNAGMASLGRVCALGIGLALITAVYLLPVWWRTLVGPSSAVAEGGGPLQRPSRFYGVGLWKLALLLTRVLPHSSIAIFCRCGLRAYAICAPGRRAAVTQNLLPVFGGDRVAAERAAWKLFDEFARKLADLWRYEAGAPVNDRFGPMTGLEHIEAARAGGRGVLLVTPHLGNWEFGAPLLAARGVPLLVITLAEPGRGLTELRQVSRARRGIETLVIGADPFAFVEIIQRLDAGAVVALLIDRPVAAGAVEVTLFDRPFRASIAAAELARASGCAVVPAVVLRGDGGYVAQAQPALAYDRRALGDRAARIAFTQEILRAFEPLIRQHPEQWFHFVPVWPRS